MFKVAQMSPKSRNISPQSSEFGADSHAFRHDLVGILPIRDGKNVSNPLRMSRIYNDLSGTLQNPSFLDESSGTKQRVMRPVGKIPNVAIVGAGISGLRCADVLIRSGARVTVYEARNRIGGRVHQALSGGHLMDVGANWVHGTENNPIADIARRTSTVTDNLEEDRAVIDSKGNRIDDELASKLCEAVWAIIVKAFRHSDTNSAEIDKYTSLLDYFRQQIPEMEKDPEQQALILEQAHMWGAFTGDSIERQSLKFFFLEECIDGENAFVASTYKKIVADIAATALADAKIRFNEEVVFLDTHDVGQAGTPPRVTIRTRSGRQETFDEVVLTTPLGWLKHNKHDAFPPDFPLPPRLLQAIENVSYGRLEKVYITFPTAFWQQDPTQTARSASSSSISDNSPTHCPSSSSSPATYPCFTHFFTPDYAPHPPNTPWNQFAVNLATLPASTNHPTLLFYLYGACGTHLLNLLKDQPPSTSLLSPYHSILRSFFRPYYSRLPNYEPNSPNCIPTAFLSTSWQLDPFAGYGSYTNFQTGLDSGDVDVEVMRHGEGIGENRGLWLAGEHTAPFIALGTTTGAYWSGETVAKRIIAMYEELELHVPDTDDVNVEEEKKKKTGEGEKTLPCFESRDAANLNGIAL